MKPLTGWGAEARRAGLVLFVTAVCGCAGPSPEAPRPSEALDAEEARRYVLEQVNSARAAEGLGQLTWDPAAAAAADRHVRDMATHGFTAQWGSDGSVPEQRFTEAGGSDLVRENAACFFDGERRELDPAPVYLRSELDKIHQAFLSELPPEDAHRRNLLESSHSRLGVGLAQPVGLRQPCLVHELVSVFGRYDALPAQASPFGSLPVAGELHEPVGFGGVGIKRLPLPRPLPAEELNQTSTYVVPEPDVLYFPPGFKTPVPVEVEGRRFSIDLPLGEPGLYAVSVWGRLPGREEQLRMVSLRTLRVE